MLDIMTKVNISDNGCWEWKLFLNPAGYGKITYMGKKYLAHRLSYLFFIGDLKSSKEFVCHKCDNPSCVNPLHLFKGDNKVNINDAQSKGGFKIADHGSPTFYNIKKCRCETCVSWYKKQYSEVVQKSKAGRSKKSCLILKAIKNRQCSICCSDIMKGDNYVYSAKYSRIYDDKRNITGLKPDKKYICMKCQSIF